MAVQISNIINYYFPFGKSVTSELVCATTCSPNAATDTTVAVAAAVDVTVMSNEPEFMTCSLVHTTTNIENKTDRELSGQCQWNICDTLEYHVAHN